MTKGKRILYNLIYPIIALVIALTLWSVVALIYDKPLVMPSVIGVLVALWQLLLDISTYTAVLSTVGRTVLCYLISVIIAGLLSVFSSQSNVFHKILSPLVTALTAVPTMAIILIIIIFFSPSNSTIVVTFLVVMPVTYNAFVTAIDSVAMQQQMLKVYKVNNSKSLRYLYMPTLIASVINSSKTTLPLALKVIVSAEVLAYTVGSIGMGMYSARLNIETATLLAWTIICVVLCYVLQAFISLLQYWQRRRACH